jgi:hypothetical protein
MRQDRPFGPWGGEKGKERMPRLLHQSERENARIAAMVYKPETAEPAETMVARAKDLSNRQEKPVVLFMQRSLFLIDSERMLLQIDYPVNRPAVRDQPAPLKKSPYAQTDRREKSDKGYGQFVFERVIAIIAMRDSDLEAEKLVPLTRAFSLKHQQPFVLMLPGSAQLIDGDDIISCVIY